MGYRQHIDEIADSASQTFDDVVGGVSRAAHQMGREWFIRSYNGHWVVLLDCRKGSRRSANHL